jgi:hypothetical protein
MPSRPVSPEVLARFSPPEGFMWVAKYENAMGLAAGTPIAPAALAQANDHLPEHVTLDEIRKVLGVRMIKVAEITEDLKPVRYTNRAARRADRKRPL